MSKVNQPAKGFCTEIQFSKPSQPFVNEKEEVGEVMAASEETGYDDLMSRIEKARERGEKINILPTTVIDDFQQDDPDALPGILVLTTRQIVVKLEGINQLLFVDPKNRLVATLLECDVAAVPLMVKEFVRDKFHAKELIFSLERNPKHCEGHSKHGHILNLYHWRNGVWRTGIVDFDSNQNPPEFSAVQWDNEYWNQMMQNDLQIMGLADLA